jgi:hypothetical protein
MSDDIYDDPHFIRYAEHFLKDVLPMLDDSAISLSIAPSYDGQTHGRGDVKYWVELGASIMLDKPIIAMVEPGAKVPERLRRVADAIIEVDMKTPSGRERASEQIAVAMAKLEEDGVLR